MTIGQASGTTDTINDVCRRSADGKPNGYKNQHTKEGGRSTVIVTMLKQRGDKHAATRGVNQPPVRLRLSVGSGGGKSGATKPVGVAVRNAPTCPTPARCAALGTRWVDSPGRRDTTALQVA